MLCYQNSTFPCLFHLHFHFICCTVDAAYEGFQKRTFIPMIILISTHLPLVVGVIVLYHKLGRKCEEDDVDDAKASMEDSSTEYDSSTDSEFEKNINESSHLMSTEESKL